MIVGMEQVIITSPTTISTAFQIIEVDHGTVLNILFLSENTRYFPKIGDPHDSHPYGQEHRDPREIIKILMSL